ncbi:MAG: AEC family transporter [Anaerotignaceae bacterium]
MIEVLFKALSFVLIIFVAYQLKQKGFFSPKDYTIVSKITLNITLPAAVITSFANFEKDNTLFLLVALGLGIDLLLILIGAILSYKKDRNMRIYYMLNFPGFNIGSFSMPFVQSFLGSYGVIATCMFDTGNAIMSSGGAYAITCAVVGNQNGKKIGMADIFKKLIHSVPFDVYIIMLVLSLLNFHVPDLISKTLSTTASANGFMAMLMLGLMLDLNIEKQHLKEVVSLLFMRYSICAVLAMVVYFFTPLPIMVKQVLVLVLFSPSPVLAPAFTQLSDGDVGVAGFSCSASIIISVLIMSILVTLMNI